MQTENNQCKLQTAQWTAGMNDDEGEDDFAGRPEGVVLHDTDYYSVLNVPREVRNSPLYIGA